jgi:hypothetical protein
MGGFVVMYSNGPANWGAGFLKIVPESSHEAESAIASRATKATCFIRQLIINNADIFTKPVEKAKFIRMRDYIMNVHSTLRGSIEDAMTCAVGASHRMMNNLLRRL